MHFGQRHFLPLLRSATLPANRPSRPRLDLGLCTGAGGGCIVAECLSAALNALDGLERSRVTTCAPFSCGCVPSIPFSPLSLTACGRLALRALSCTLRKLSSSSPQRTPDSSRVLSRLGRSKPVLDDAGVALAPNLASVLFWRT